MNNCSIKKCDREAKKRNMCLAHYQRWKDHGECFSKRPIVNVKDMMSRFKSKLRRRNKNGCIKWSGWKNENGYGKFSVGNIYKLAHRMAYELFVGKIPEGKFILHKCDVPDCCNVEHLYIGTQEDNMRDVRERNRRNNSGSKNGHAKLTEKEVIYIKSLLKTVSCAKLSREFGVSESCIHDIKHGRSWSEIT